MRWAIRCTRCCRTSGSRSCTRTTRSSSRKCRRRCPRRCCSSSWLERATDRDERIVLLQHAIDNITSTFYTQVMFADFELAAHERVERDEPFTSDVLNALYLRAVRGLLRRRGRRRAADAADVGAHPALLPHAVLRLPVRHLLCLGGEAGPGDRHGTPGGARRCPGPVPGPARVGRQRPSDDPASAGWGRFVGAVDRPRGRRTARRPRQVAWKRYFELIAFLGFRASAQWIPDRQFLRQGICPIVVTD